LMFMAFAIAEPCGSNIMTIPLKSSLKVGVLHLGQMFPVVIR